MNIDVDYGGQSYLNLLKVSSIEDPDGFKVAGKVLRLKEMLARRDLTCNLECLCGDGSETKNSSDLKVKLVLST